MCQHYKSNISGFWLVETEFFNNDEKKMQNRSISCKKLIFPLDVVFYGAKSTVFENHRKSLIQHCERSELRLHFEWTKVH